MEQYDIKSHGIEPPHGSVILRPLFLRRSLLISSEQFYVALDFIFS